MELHEYQIKSLLQRFRIPSPPHLLVSLGDSVEDAVARLDEGPYILRPQVHGEGQQTIVAESLASAVGLLKKILGSTEVTSLSGPQGFVVKKVLLMPAVDPVKEMALSIACDRSAQITVSITSNGRVVSEQVEGKSLHPFQIRRLVFGSRFRPPLSDLVGTIVDRAVQMFFEFDALFLEIRPLALFEDGSLQSLNARMSVDDAALFRQPEIKLFADPDQIGPRIHAPPYLCAQGDGTIAVLANGKGLAFASMDLVSALGGDVGKVVDLGSTIMAGRVVRGLRMMREEQGIKKLFLNLFTGIEDAERIAWIISKEIQALPIVVRLEGTNGAAGRRVLNSVSPLCFVTESLVEAAKKIVQGLPCRSS